MPFSEVVVSLIIMSCSLEEFGKLGNEAGHEPYETGQPPIFRLGSQINDTERLVANVLAHKDATTFHPAAANQNLTNPLGDLVRELDFESGHGSVAH